VSGQSRLLPGDWGWLDDWLVRLVDGGASGIVAAVLAIVVAVGIGVVHAAGPGHGKVLVGSYLAGTDGRRRDAVALGVLIAAMHTGSVLTLGAAYIATQRLPWGGAISHVLELVVALAIVAVGLVTFHRARRRGRARADAAGRRWVRVPAGHPATVGPAGHHGGPVHELGGSAPQPAHVHDLPVGVAPLSRSGVLALAAAGGLVPSPSAFLVLVTAVALGRPWFGLALVVAFSVGLAVTLAALGIVVVGGRDRLLARSGRGGWAGRAAAALPAVAAAGVVLAGLVMTALALARF
jgi:nickel/cobalt transporter (NicO) family protein